jgi:hypothetical protein
VAYVDPSPAYPSVPPPGPPPQEATPIAASKASSSTRRNMLRTHCESGSARNSSRAFRASLTAARCYGPRP